MSATTNQSEAPQPTLSEKARRLLAAHDREVSQISREIIGDRGAHAFRMAG